MFGQDAQPRRKADELVERYLAAVARRLPPKQAADIAAEMREAILAKLDAREAELGRPADKAEAAAVIKTFGSPILAASRYGGRDYLLGPAVYPYFWPTQRIIIGVIAALAIVGGVVRGFIANNPWQVIGHAFGWAWQGAWIGFAITTAVFIAIERTGASLKYEESWNPRLLPPDSTIKPKSLFESLFALVWDAMFIAWWTGVVQFSSVFGPTPEHAPLAIHLSEAWAGVHDAILAIAVLGAATHVADILHPAWSQARSVAAIIGQAGTLAVCWVLARSGPLVVIDGLAPRLADLRLSVELVERISLAGTALGVGIGLAVEAWRLARSIRAPQAPALA